MMAVDVATVVVVAAQAYLAIGAAFSIPFVLFFAQRLDPAVPGSTWGFRLMILPGAAALWPLLLLRVLRGHERAEERNAHRAAAADVSTDRLIKREHSP